MKQDYSRDISRAIHSMLNEDDWNFSFCEETGVFRFGYDLDGRIQDIRFLIVVHDSDFNVYSQLPIGADPKDLSTMTRLERFLAHANHGLRFGNFEVDHDNGKIRFKTYVDCEGLDAPTRDMILNSIYCHFVVVQQYELGFGKIVFSDISADDAIALCEPAQKTKIQLTKDLDGQDDLYELENLDEDEFYDEEYSLQDDELRLLSELWEDEESGDEIADETTGEFEILENDDPKKPEEDSEISEAYSRLDALLVCDDELLVQVLSFIKQCDAVLVSNLQKEFKIGYARATRLLDFLEGVGILARGGRKDSSSPTEKAFPITQHRTLAVSAEELQMYIDKLQADADEELME